MTRSELLVLLLERLRLSENGLTTFTWSEIQQWPENAHKHLASARLLIETADAQAIECPGCERHCPKPVRWHACGARSAFIYCNEPEAYGLFNLDRMKLKRWRSSVEHLTAAVARLLGITSTVHMLPGGSGWALGLLGGHERHGEVMLLMDPDPALIVGGQTIPLVHILTLTNRGLTASRKMVIKILDGVGKQPAVGVGSKEWLRKRAQKAANALHDQPGGYREKQKRIRALWQSGRYPSRNVCAEREHTGLGMSLSTARKALVGVPKNK